MFEKWYSFKRIFLDKGFIDVWIGNSMDDPNEEFASSDMTFFNHVFYRLDGNDPWISSEMFDGMMDFIRNNDGMTSDEVWNKTLKHK